jgi:HD-GYP domain-containing protein (c-di-GMP phosphodiesterase class II)
MMTAGDYWSRGAMLRSKVARRMFLIFVGCALLPVVVLAVVAFVDVRDHLSTLSANRLRQGSKSAGMTIIERVSFLEGNLRLIAAGLATGRVAPPAAAGREAAVMADRRFLSLAVLDDSGRLLRLLSGPTVAYPALDAPRRAHLDTGAMLVTTGPTGGTPALFAFLRLDPAVHGGSLLASEIDPEYLWGGDGLLSPPVEMCVFEPSGGTLFTSLPTGIPAAELKRAVAVHGPSGGFEWQHGGTRYVAGYWTVFMRPTYLAEWILVQSEPRDEVLQPLRQFAWTFTLIVLLAFWVVTFATLRQIRRSTVPIEQLLEATRKLREEDFSHRVHVSSNDEFEVLGNAFNEMTESIERHLSVMNTINRIGVSLSIERDESRLLETVLSGAQDVFNADGAGLFLVSRDGELRPALARIASLSLRQAAGNGGGEPWGIAVLPTLRHATERIITSCDVHADTNEDFSALVDFDRRMGYLSRSFLSVPLRNHENESLGVVLLINAQSRTTGAIVPFSEKDQRLMESLASQAAVAITKNRLVQDFKGLFEGLTDLISTAIDEQSPHTGGHVRRVVVLSTMIGEALARSADAAVREQALSEEQLYELRIAALLHDCGKLTTPVHLTDKATKLQAIVDRMWLIEARAETARRQFRVELLNDLLTRLTGGDGRELRDLDDRAAGFDRQLEQDLATLRRCNQGVENMSSDVWDQVRAIAERYRWTNARGEQDSLVSSDELYHLSTRSGTLTREEREIVQGHVLSTMRMLERLPYPKSLRNVPAFAAAHHERIRGDGYPLQLAGDEIPIQGRIIAIADVLEALTARDRPYRHAMTLPEAMQLLGELARSGWIDEGLYHLIVSEGIHQRYASEYLHLDTSVN